MKKTALKSAYFLLALLIVFSYFEKRELPGPESLHSTLSNEPIQQESDRPDFTFPYRGKEYHVKPQAEYELWGLVVTHNDINALFNYYTDENSVNLKDVCVIWGDNASSGVYNDEKIKFKSGEFTCYYSWSGRLEKTFHSNQLSNNHLLTADPALQDLIKGVNIGDQIHLRGALVDYAEAGSSWYRETSLSRDDSNHTSRGAGACEIFYVDRIDILARNKPFWNAAYDYSRYALVALAAANFIYFLIGIYFHGNRVVKIKGSTRI